MTIGPRWPGSRGCTPRGAGAKSDQGGVHEGLDNTRDTEHCGTIKESDTEAETETVNGDVECISLSKIDGEWKINDV